RLTLVSALEISLLLLQSVLLITMLTLPVPARCEGQDSVSFFPDAPGKIGPDRRESGSMGSAAGSVLAPLRFGSFVLDEAGFELLRDGQPVAVEPRALKLLLHLARNRQRAVPSAELAAILW